MMRHDLRAEPAARRPRLYRQLTFRLVLPMLVIVAAGGAVGYYTARQQTSAVFDRWLLDAAVSLARQVGMREGRVEIDLPPAAATMLAYDEIDRTYYSVVRAGQVLVGVAGLPADGQGEDLYSNGRAYDAVFQGQPVRVALVRPECAGCEGVTVRVAETLLKRDRAARSLLWLLPALALLLAVTVASVTVAVRRTVRPLEQLAQRWNRESHASLRPIAQGNLPVELAPFAQALNDLLARLRGMLERERQFAATAAHQLRTPLTALRLGLDRARRAPDLAATRAVLDELESSTQHTARLIQQLLLLARLDPQARIEVGEQEAELDAIAHDVGTMLFDLAGAAGVQLELQLAPQPVRVAGQPELIAEALANLVDNAIHAAGPGGRVLVEVLGHPARVRVTDSGPGIPVAERERIFERFSRGSSACWPGTGLGLAIVHDVAAIHGARVRVDDAPEGGGAAFEIRF